MRLMEEVTMKGLLPLESAMLSFYCLCVQLGEQTITLPYSIYLFFSFSLVVDPNRDRKCAC